LTRSRNSLIFKELYALTGSLGGHIRRISRAVCGAAIAALVASPAMAQNDGLDRRIIRGLEFVGNRAIDDYTLSISIATSNSSRPLLGLLGTVEKRYFDEREFRRDVLRLRLLYTQSGYIDARIDTVVSRQADQVRIRFIITEGEPVRVARLDISGAEHVIATRELVRDLPLAVGDPFNRFLFQQSADSIRVTLQNRGYPFAQVFRGFDLDTAARVANIAFDADPGSQATVERITVVGGDAIGENVIRRMVPVREGAVFHQQDLYSAQRDLYRMGMFNYVNVRLEDSLPESPDDSLVSVQIRVTEGNLHRVRLGTGYGTVDCFRGLAGWSAFNFLGGARTLDVTGQVSKIGTGSPFSLGFQDNVCGVLSDEAQSNRLDLNYNLTVGVGEPFLFSRRNSGTLALFAEKRGEFKAYLREAVGGDVSVTHRSRFDIPITLSYSLTWGRTQAEPAIFCTFLNVCRETDTRIFQERRFQSTLGLQVVRDRSNSALDPSRGTNVTAELRWASGLLGSDSLAAFTRAVTQFASYHRLGRRSVVAWRVRLGTILSPNFGFAGQGIEFVPPEERFYGGGPNSVRGFGQNALGPLVRVIGVPDTVFKNDGAEVDRIKVDPLPSPIGGNQLLFANIEFRFPLPVFAGRLRAAVFVDAGQVYQRGSELIRLSNLRVTPGVGFRLSSPLGPVRLDIAYNGYQETAGPLFQREGNELVEVSPSFRPTRPGGLFRRLQLHFSVGQAF